MKLQFCLSKCSAIFDRWGALLYQENNDDPMGWNGIYKGNPVPAGVFVCLVTYQMEGSAAVQRRSGSVTLVR